MAKELSLSKSDFPSDWDDDVRMNFLFSSFRDRCVNPEGWDAKMKYWSVLIQEVCHKHGISVIDRNLPSAFERKGKIPMCLDTVLDNMLRHGYLIRLSEFNKIEQEKGWLGWGFDVLVQKPVSWGFSTVQSFLISDKVEEKFVIISVVKNFAVRILRHHYESVDSDLTDHVVFLDTFKEECKDFCSDTNFDLAVIELQRQKNAIVFEDRGRKVIKFRRLVCKKIEPPSELERGILGLRNARDSIVDEMDKLEKEISSCNETARELAKTGLKTKAMLFLKKRKRLEILLGKKSAALDNVEHLLCKLQNSTSEKMVLDAYQGGVKAIKSAISGLKLDEAYETFDDVKDTLDECNEIQEALGKSSFADDSLEEFEDELAEILSDKKPATSPATRSKTSPKVTDEDLLRRLAALRAPPEDVPPVKKPAMSALLRT